MPGIDARQFRSLVIMPALNELQAIAGVPHSLFADDLLMATAAQETGLGHYLHQTGTGPALGVYQVEPATLADLLAWISQRPNLQAAITQNRVARVPVATQIIYDLRLATVIARLNYYRRPEGLPDRTSFDALWHWYKQYWNTSAGAATEQTFRHALTLTDIRL